MFGRLPRIYRWRTVAIALLVFVAAGAWLVTSTPIPLVTPAGGLVGAVAGIAVGYALVHDFSRRTRSVQVRPRA